MSGRLLSPVLLIAVALIVRCDFKRFRLPVAAVLAVALIATPTSPLRASIDYGRQSSNLAVVQGIADERAHYYSATGLFAPGRKPLSEHPLAQAGHRVRERGMSPVTAGNIGIFGYFAGPKIYVLDGFALADPLLARLPIEPLLRAFVRRPQMPVFAEELVELAAAFGERAEVSTARSLYHAYLQERPGDSHIADRLRALSEPGE